MSTASHQQSVVTNPLLPLALAFAAGIVLSHTCPFHLGVMLAVAVSLTLFSVGCVFLKWQSLGVVVLSSSFFLLGACFTIVETEFESPRKLSLFLDSGQIPSDKPVALTGVIDGPVEVAPDALHLTLRVQEVSFSETHRVVDGLTSVIVLETETPGEIPDQLQLHHGAEIRIIAELDRQDRFRNPGVSGLSEFLEHKGYDAIAIVKTPMLLERIADAKSSVSRASLYRWRQALETRISSAFSSDTAGVLNAAFLGNRYGLSRETSNKFREGGTFHVLVISGLHISFIGGLMFTIARRLTKKRPLQFLLSNTSLWFYTLAVGASVSVLRAAFMFSFVSLAPILSRRAASLNSLAAAALLLLAWRPSQLFDPSFQLTFLSVFAIVAFSWPLLSRLAAIGHWRPTRDTPAPPTVNAWLQTFAELLFWSEKGWQSELSHSTHDYKLFKIPLAAKLERWHVQTTIRYAFGAIVVSASVQLTLIPLLVFHFHRISLAALLLNIFVSALMILLTVVALLALIVGSLSATLAIPLVLVANALNWLMVNSVAPFSRVHLASIRVPEYSGKPACIYALYFIPLICLAVALSRWNPFEPRVNASKTRYRLKLVLILQLLLAFLIVVRPFSASSSPRLRIDFLDVGQGDAALITMPDATTLLIDGGGRPEFRRSRTAEPFDRDRRTIGEGVVSEFLWHRGLDQVDYILATHADADHIDGLNDVSRDFSVRAALVGKEPEDDAEFEKFRVTTTSQSVPLIKIAAGDTLRFGDVSLDVLWPPSDQSNTRSQNNDSVVLRVRKGDRAILLTGDIESGAEWALVRSGPDLRADVVKVAHHGSKTSSVEKFVNASHPKYAIISVGRKSMFGHPHAEVVKRWTAIGAKVLTTGKCGTITVETDGEALEVKTFVECRTLR